MGQQQLLLVILVTIVVGVATIVAVNVLNNRVVQANRDAVRQDLTQAASYVQSLWERPTTMDGAGRDFTSMNVEHILRYINVPSSSYQSGNSEAINENGTFRVEIESETELLIIGEPNSGPPNLEITVERNSETGIWEFTVSESSEDADSGGGGVPQRGTDSQRQGRF
jgi:hypothetical protein